LLGDCQAISAALVYAGNCQVPQPFKSFFFNEAFLIKYTASFGTQVENHQAAESKAQILKI
jgi:hypothetical protein